MYMEQGSAMVPDGTARRDVEAGATMWVRRTGSASRSAGKSGYTFELKQEWAQELCKSESEGGIKSVTRETINAVHKCGGSRVMQHSVQRQAQCLTSRRGRSQRADQRCGQMRESDGATCTRTKCADKSRRPLAIFPWAGSQTGQRSGWQEQERGKSRQKQCPE